MKVNELLTEISSVKDLPPEIRQEYVTDNTKWMRALAQKHGYTLDLGAGGPIKVNKQIIGYTYHFFPLKPSGRAGATAPGDIKDYWKEFIEHFKHKYDIRVGTIVDSTSTDNDVDSVSDIPKGTFKIRLITKGMTAGDTADSFRKKHLTQTENKLNGYLITFLRAHVTRHDDWDNVWTPDAKEKMAQIENLLAKEKEKGYDYPKFEAKLKDKSKWKDILRRSQLSYHRKNFKDAHENPYSHEHAIDDLEADTRDYGFNHPELEKEMPLSSRKDMMEYQYESHHTEQIHKGLESKNPHTIFGSLNEIRRLKKKYGFEFKELSKYLQPAFAKTFWKAMLDDKEVTREGVFKYLLGKVKAMATHGWENPDLENMIDMAKKAGIDDPEEFNVIRRAAQHIKSSRE